MKWFPLVLLISVLFLLSELHYQGMAQTGGWEEVGEGLYIGVFESPQKSVVGDSRIWIIKIDPGKYEFKLLCAAELGVPNKTVREWCQQFHLIGAINAGMFRPDGKTNVGYMKNFRYTNNGKIHPGYHSVAAFQPVQSNLPLFRIFDIDEDDMAKIIRSYHIVIQNLRLIKRPGQNRWSRQAKKWSEAALGEDKDGNVLFIFSRSPYSMHDLNDILIHLPIGLVAAQHVEGGPEASLYFSYGNKTIELFGSYETGFNENDANSTYWPIPNVIGFVKR